MNHTRIHNGAAVAILVAIAVFLLKTQLSAARAGVNLWIYIAFVACVLCYILLRGASSRRARNHKKDPSSSTPDTERVQL